jgi:hypothetical protein
VFISFKEGKPGESVGILSFVKKLWYLLTIKYNIKAATKLAAFFSAYPYIFSTIGITKSKRKKILFKNPLLQSLK